MFQRIAPPPVSSQQVIPTNASGISKQDTEFVVSKPNLVGFWQDIPFFASSYSERYRFDDSGNYAWYASNADCEQSLIQRTGTYDITGDKLMLTVFTETSAVGVELGYDSSDCGSSGGFPYATLETTQLRTPKKIELSVSTSCQEFTQAKKEWPSGITVLNYSACISIDGQDFYQLEKTPHGPHYPEGF